MEIDWLDVFNGRHVSVIEQNVNQHGHPNEYQTEKNGQPNFEKGIDCVVRGFHRLTFQ